jgi:hypothetical protein
MHELQQQPEKVAGGYSGRFQIDGNRRCGVLDVGELGVGKPAQRNQIVAELATFGALPVQCGADIDLVYQASTNKRLTYRHSLPPARFAPVR